MEFFTRAYSQLQGVYRSMTPGSRLTAGALAVVVLLSLGFLGLHQNAEAFVDLMHGMTFSAGQLSAIREGVRQGQSEGI